LESWPQKIGVAHTQSCFVLHTQTHSASKKNLYGNELYMVEERATTNQIGTPSFGTPLAIVSTEDV
jgi:hypothetical protein